MLEISLVMMLHIFIQHHDRFGPQCFIRMNPFWHRYIGTQARRPCHITPAWHYNWSPTRWASPHFHLSPWRYLHFYNRVPIYFLGGGFLSGDNAEAAHFYIIWLRILQLYIRGNERWACKSSMGVIFSPSPSNTRMCSINNVIPPCSHGTASKTLKALLLDCHPQRTIVSNLHQHTDKASLSGSAVGTALVPKWRRSPVVREILSELS